MLDYAPDPEATATAYASGQLEDRYRESYIDIAGHEHLRGVDRRNRRDYLYRLEGGLCADCGRFCSPLQGDMAHRGKTTKTRCECINRVLNNGDICTGIDWLCTMNPRRGGGRKSCHAKRHNREVEWTQREAVGAAHKETA